MTTIFRKDRTFSRTGVKLNTPLELLHQRFSDIVQAWATLNRNMHQNTKDEFQKMSTTIYQTHITSGVSREFQEITTSRKETRQTMEMSVKQMQLT